MATVQTEQTSKKLKGQLVACRLGYVVAAFWALGKFASIDAGVTGENDVSFTGPTVLFIVALIGALVTRFRIWWNHG